MDKGKGKAIDHDFEDLSPTITYRHVLSQNIGPKHPLRVIALCDSDAFYAACEQTRLGVDPNAPLVVLQWDMLIAVNYAARKFGISRMDKLKDAKKRCPHLLVVHVATYKEGDKEPQYWDNPDTRTHKVSLDHYRRESMKIINMFREELPTGEIGTVTTNICCSSVPELKRLLAEKASIDEAFIDFSVPVRDLLLERYPYLAHVPADAPDGLDSPLPPPPPIEWSRLGNVIPVQPPDPDADSAAAASSTEAGGSSSKVATSESSEGDCPTTWHDVALSIAAELMGKIRETILSKLGYSTSAGIARNKFLAKLVASYRKPNNQSIVRNAAIPNYLRPMEFQKIRFLGGKLGDAIAKEYDVSTVGDLLTINLEDMQRKFGEGSIWVYEVLRGIDRSEVKEKTAINKSMLASKNLAQAITKPSDGPHWIRVLAAELALRLAEARETTPGLWPKTVVLHIRQGYDMFRSKQAAFPFTRAVTVDLIAAAGDKLWRELVGTDGTRRAPLKVTNVQLSFTGITTMEVGQRTIEGFFGADAGAYAGSKPAPAAAASGTPGDLGAQDLDGDSHAEGSMPLSYTCTRCGKQLSLPPPSEAVGGRDEAATRRALDTLRMEHDDFHFAQDLARSPGPSPKKRRKVKEPEGIAKFFVQKR